MENLLDQAARVHLAQQPAVPVVFDQRSRLPLVRLDPLPDDVLAVVRANDERGAALVADAGLLRRGPGDVIPRVVFRTEPSAPRPLSQLLPAQGQGDPLAPLREP